MNQPPFKPGDIVRLQTKYWLLGNTGALPDEHIVISVLDNPPFGHYIILDDYYLTGPGTHAPEYFEHTGKKASKFQMAMLGCNL